MLISLYLLTYYSFYKATGKKINILIVILPFIITYSAFLGFGDLGARNIDIYLNSIIGAFFFFLPFFIFHKNIKYAALKQVSNRQVSSTRLRFWMMALVIANIYVISVMANYGFPLLSENPNLVRLYFAQDNSLAVRVINYVNPMLAMICLYFFVNQKKRSQITAYLIFFLVCLTPFLLGNKGSVLMLTILFIAFSRTMNESRIVNEKVLILVGAASVVIGFILHMQVSNSTVVFLSIIERLGNYSGVNVVFNEFIPNHGYMYGETFIYEMNGILSLLGITEGITTQTVGNYIARWFSGGDSSYLMEYVFPIFIVGYINTGFIGTVLFSFILGVFFVFFYITYLKKSDIISVWYLMLAYTCLLIFASGKPGSFIVGNILTFSIFFFFMYSSRIFFKNILK
jgi:oligosaccharide repeat unit polymerase